MKEFSLVFPSSNTVKIKSTVNRQQNHKKKKTSFNRRENAGNGEKSKLRILDFSLLRAKENLHCSSVQLLIFKKQKHQKTNSLKISPPFPQFRRQSISSKIATEKHRTEKKKNLRFQISFSFLSLRFLGNQTKVKTRNLNKLINKNNIKIHGAT